MQSHGVEVLYFPHDAETAVSQSPLLVVCLDNQKIVSGGQKPILADPWPPWACIWQRGHVEAYLLLQLPQN
jgi:hypothetical protein